MRPTSLADVAFVASLTEFFTRPQIVIHGRHGGWIKALAPRSPVWRELGGASVVLGHRGGLLPTWRRRFVVPLFERDMVSVPRPCLGLMPTPEARVRLADKAQFARYVRMQGVEALVPATFDPADAEGFPAVLKRTDDTAGRGIVLVNSRAELAAQLASPEFRDRPVVLQELIEGTTEYVLHVVSVGGRIVWHCCYAYLLPLDRTIRSRRNYLRLERVSVSAEDIAVFERFLRPLNFDGPANFDFKRRSDGRIAVFEINPRFGGSLMQAGNVRDLAQAMAVILEHGRWYEREDAGAGARSPANNTVSVAAPAAVRAQ